MDSSPGRNLSPQPKKGVHIHVKLPSGTEVHEFILPVGYTVDQVKRAIFKQIPDLAKETNPNDYQLKLRDNLRSKEEILNVEFSKLQNLDTVKSAADGETPLELSIMSTKPQGNHHQPQGPRGRPVSAFQHGAGHDDTIHASAPAHVYRTPTKDASEQTSPRRASPATITSPRRSSPSGAVSPRQLPQSATSPYSAPSQKAAATAQPISPRSTSPRLTARSTSSPSLVPKSELGAAAGPPSAVDEPQSGTAGLSNHALSQSTPVLPPPPTTTASADVDTRDDSIKTLQDQLAQAHAKTGRLNARLARIARLVRLELLPLSSNTPIALNDDPSKRPVRDSDIAASEKRLRATLGLILAEIERTDDESVSSPSKAQAPAPAAAAQDSLNDTSVLALIGAANQAGAALTTSTRELRVRSERTVSSADHDEAKRNRSLSSNAKKNSSIDGIAGRMNLEVPSSSLGSSVSSPSAIASGSASPPPDLGSGASPLPPRKILTPEERTEMLQQEFIDTEETYLRSLQKLHDHFEVPLEASGLLTPEQCDTLFSRVRTQLLEIHKHLLETIKNRQPGASFSDGLLVIAPYLKLYTEYVNNHPEAISLLIELNANSKKFAALLKQIETKPEVDSQDLSSYLIRPIQRLPRYELLLRDMVKYTTEETEHLKLSRLLEAVKKVNEHLNEAKRKRDNSTKMAAIQSNLILGKAKGFSLFSSQTRTFLRDDTLLVKKVKKEKTTFTRHHFFLFNDLLLDTVKTREGKYKLTRVYLLAETSFMKYEGESDTVALFQTSSSESAVEDLTQAIHVKADQGGDIDGWLQDTLKAKATQRVDESREGRYHVVL